MARNRSKPIEVGTTLQLRVSQYEDPIVLEWLRAQSGSFADVIRFLIQVDVEMNGMRDYGEIIPRNLTHSWVERYVESLRNGQNDSFVPGEYASVKNSHVPRQLQLENQEVARLANNNEFNADRSQDKSTIEESTGREPVSVKEKPVEENLTVEQMEALIANLQQKVGKKNQEEFVDVNETVTDSINRVEQDNQTSQRRKAEAKIVKKAPKKVEEENSVNGETDKEIAGAEEESAEANLAELHSQIDFSAYE